MSGQSYYFDPCSVDGSDKEEETLDNWKPSVKMKGMPKSEWRQKQNEGNHNQKPSLDDHKKIRMFLKKGYPDHQIMDAFGINCDTLAAIKDERYSCVEGIELSDVVKITKRFNQVDKKIDKIFEALQLLSEVFKTGDTIKRMQFKTLVGKPKRVTTKQKAKDDEEE